MQAGGQRFDPAQLHQGFGVEMREISFEEIKVCVCQMAVRLFCIHCEEKIDLEASRCFGLMSRTSETFPSEPFDGLAGRRLVRDWR